MSVVTMTPDGVQRGNVERTDFFNEARTALIKAGARTTAWVDYLGLAPGVFATIRKNRIEVTGGVYLTTTKIEKAVALVKG